MVPDSYDAVVTSPPYNIGVDYGDGVNDRLSDEDYFDFSAEWVEEALRVAPVAVINFGAPSSAPMNLARFMMACAEVGVVQQHIAWVKAVSSEEWSYGHFKPVNSQRYITNVWESVFIVSRTGDAKLDRLAVGVPFKDKSNAQRFAGNGGRDLRCRGNVWFVPYPTRTEKLDHPATFPVALAEMMIKIVGAQRVLDPFVGSGTTITAARNVGASADGIDLKEWA